MSLEQTVEAVHRHHQLQALREGMAIDSAREKLDAAHMEDAATVQLKWLLHRITQVNAAVAQHQPVANLPVPQIPLYDYPASPTWKAANNSGLLNQMPQEEIKAYSEADDIVNNVYLSWRDSIACHAQRRAFEIQYDGSFSSTSNSTINASIADLIEDQLFLRNEMASTASVRNELRYLIGAEIAILRGARTLDEIQQEEKQVVGSEAD